MGKKKDKSQVGRTVQTRDEYFEGQGDYRKKGYEGKGNYRKAVVIAQHGKKLALVKLTTSAKGKPLTNQKKSRFKPYVNTKDDKGEPITYGKKFRGNNRKKDLPKTNVAEIAKDCFRGKGKQSKINRNKVREMKGRTKK